MSEVEGDDETGFDWDIFLRGWSRDAAFVKQYVETGRVPPGAPFWMKTLADKG